MNDWKPRMSKDDGLSVGFVESFRGAAHGNAIALGKLAAVTRQGDRIVVTPFEAANVPAVLRALTEARLNAYALNPRAVVVVVPPKSGEQRAAIARQVKKLGEEAKVAVRSIRQDARKQIAARGCGSERAVQVATDAAVGEVERLVKERVDGIGA